MKCPNRKRFDRKIEYCNGELTKLITRWRCDRCGKDWSEADLLDEIERRQEIEKIMNSIIGKNIREFFKFGFNQCKSFKEYRKMNDIFDGLIRGLRQTPEIIKEEEYHHWFDNLNDDDYEGVEKEKAELRKQHEEAMEKLMNANEEEFKKLIKKKKNK